MTKVTLMEHPLSPYAQKVKIALIEKGIPFETIAPMGASQEVQQAFLAANPRGEVPVLLHRDLALYDSTVILEYIEDCWPEPPLLPASAEERARVRLLEDVMDTHFEANLWGLAEITIFARATGDKADAIIRYGTEQIEFWFSWLDRQLGDRTFFNGDTFGWGDIAVAPYVHDAGRFAIVPDSGSNLGDWMKRVSERASIANAHAEADAAELDPAVMAAAVKAGFKREYRDHRLEWIIRAGGIDIVQTGLADDNIRFTEAFQEQADNRS